MVHRVQDSPLDGLEAIPHIREGTRGDHAHGVVEVPLSGRAVECDRFNSALFGRHTDPCRWGEMSEGQKGGNYPLTNSADRAGGVLFFSPEALGSVSDLGLERRAHAQP